MSDLTMSDCTNCGDRLPEEGTDMVLTPRGGYCSVGCYREDGARPSVSDI